MLTKGDRHVQAPDIARLVAEGSAIDEALRHAAQEALVLHKRLGLTVPVWRNDRVEWVPPEQIDALLQQSESPAE